MGELSSSEDSHELSPQRSGAIATSRAPNIHLQVPGADHNLARDIAHDVNIPSPRSETKAFVLAHESNILGDIRKTLNRNDSNGEILNPQNNINSEPSTSQSRSKAAMPSSTASGTFSGVNLRESGERRLRDALDCPVKGIEAVLGRSQREREKGKQREKERERERSRGRETVQGGPSSEQKLKVTASDSSNSGGAKQKQKVIPIAQNQKAAERDSLSSEANPTPSLDLTSLDAAINELAGDAAAANGGDGEENVNDEDNVEDDNITDFDAQWKAQIGTDIISDKKLSFNRKARRQVSDVVRRPSPVDSVGSGGATGGGGAITNSSKGGLSQTYGGRITTSRSESRAPSGSCTPVSVMSAGKFNDGSNKNGASNTNTASIGLASKFAGTDNVNRIPVSDRVSARTSARTSARASARTSGRASGRASGKSSMSVCTGRSSDLTARTSDRTTRSSERSSTSFRAADGSVGGGSVGGRASNASVGRGSVGSASGRGSTGRGSTGRGSTGSFGGRSSGGTNRNSNTDSNSMRNAEALAASGRQRSKSVGTANAGNSTRTSRNRKATPPTLPPWNSGLSRTSGSTGNLRNSSLKDSQNNTRNSKKSLTHNGETSKRTSNFPNNKNFFCESNSHKGFKTSMKDTDNLSKTAAEPGHTAQPLPPHERLDDLGISGERKRRRREAAETGNAEKTDDLKDLVLGVRENDEFLESIVTMGKEGRYLPSNDALLNADGKGNSRPDLTGLWKTDSGLDVEVIGNCVCWLSLVDKEKAGTASGGNNNSGQNSDAKESKSISLGEDGLPVFGAKSSNEENEGKSSNEETDGVNDDVPCTYFTDQWRLNVQGEEYTIERCDYVEDLVVGVAWSDGDYWRRDQNELDEMIKTELQDPEGELLASKDADFNRKLDDFLRSSADGIVGHNNIGGGQNEGGQNGSTSGYVGSATAAVEKVIRDVDDNENNNGDDDENNIENKFRTWVPFLSEKTRMEILRSGGPGPKLRSTFAGSSSRASPIGSTPSGSPGLGSGTGTGLGATSRKEARKQRLEKLLEYRMHSNVERMQKKTKSRNSNREVAFPLRIPFVGAAGGGKYPRNMARSHKILTMNGGLDVCVSPEEEDGSSTFGPGSTKGRKSSLNKAHGTFGTASTNRMPMSKKDLWKLHDAEEDRENSVRENSMRNDSRSISKEIDSLGWKNDIDSLRNDTSPFKPPRRSASVGAARAAVASRGRASGGNASTTTATTTAATRRGASGSVTNINGRNGVNTRSSGRSSSARNSTRNSGSNIQRKNSNSNGRSASSGSLFGGFARVRKKGKGAGKGQRNSNRLGGIKKGDMNKRGELNTKSPEQNRFEHNLHEILQTGQQGIVVSTERREAWRSIGRERLSTMNHKADDYYTWSPTTGRKRMIRKAATPGFMEVARERKKNGPDDCFSTPYLDYWENRAKFGSTEGSNIPKDNNLFDTLGVRPLDLEKYDKLLQGVGGLGENLNLDDERIYPRPGAKDRSLPSGSGAKAGADGNAEFDLNSPGGRARDKIDDIILEGDEDINEKNKINAMEKLEASGLLSDLDVSFNTAERFGRVDKMREAERRREYNKRVVEEREKKEIERRTGLSPPPGLTLSLSPRGKDSLSPGGTRGRQKFGNQNDDGTEDQFRNSMERALEVVNKWQTENAAASAEDAIVDEVDKSAPWRPQPVDLEKILRGGIPEKSVREKIQDELTQQEEENTLTKNSTHHSNVNPNIESHLQSSLVKLKISQLQADLPYAGMGSNGQATTKEAMTTKPIGETTIRVPGEGVDGEEIIADEWRDKIDPVDGELATLKAKVDLVEGLDQLKLRERVDGDLQGHEPPVDVLRAALKSRESAMRDSPGRKREAMAVGRLGVGKGGGSGNSGDNADDGEGEGDDKNKNDVGDGKPTFTGRVYDADGGEAGHNLTDLVISPEKPSANQFESIEQLEQEMKAARQINDFEHDQENNLEDNIVDNTIAIGMAENNIANVNMHHGHIHSTTDIVPDLTRLHVLPHKGPTLSRDGLSDLNEACAKEIRGSRSPGRVVGSGIIGGSGIGSLGPSPLVSPTLSSIAKTDSQPSQNGLLRPDYVTVHSQLNVLTSLNSNPVSRNSSGRNSNRSSPTDMNSTYKSFEKHSQPSPQGSLKLVAAGISAGVNRAVGSIHIEKVAADTDDSGAKEQTKPSFTKNRDETEKILAERRKNAVEISNIEKSWKNVSAEILELSTSGNEGNNNEGNNIDTENYNIESDTADAIKYLNSARENVDKNIRKFRRALDPAHYPQEYFDAISGGPGSPREYEQIAASMLADFTRGHSPIDHNARTIYGATDVVGAREDSKSSNSKNTKSKNRSTTRSNTSTPSRSARRTPSQRTPSQRSPLREFHLQLGDPKKRQSPRTSSSRQKESVSRTCQQNKLRQDAEEPDPYGLVANKGSIDTRRLGAQGISPHQKSEFIRGDDVAGGKASGAGGASSTLLAPKRSSWGDMAKLDSPLMIPGDGTGSGKPAFISDGTRFLDEMEAKMRRTSNLVAKTGKKELDKLDRHQLEELRFLQKKLGESGFGGKAGGGKELDKMTKKMSRYERAALEKKAESLIKGAIENKEKRSRIDREGGHNAKQPEEPEGSQSVRSNRSTRSHQSHKSHQSNQSTALSEIREKMKSKTESPAHANIMEGSHNSVKAAGGGKSKAPETANVEANVDQLDIVVGDKAAAGSKNEESTNVNVNDVTPVKGKGNPEEMGDKTAERTADFGAIDISVYDDRFSPSPAKLNLEFSPRLNDALDDIHADADKENCNRNTKNNNNYSPVNRDKLQNYSPRTEKQLLTKITTEEGENRRKMEELELLEGNRVTNTRRNDNSLRVRARAHSSAVTSPEDEFHLYSSRRNSRRLSTLSDRNPLEDLEDFKNTFSFGINNNNTNSSNTNNNNGKAGNGKAGDIATPLGNRKYLIDLVEGNFGGNYGGGDKENAFGPNFGNLTPHSNITQFSNYNSSSRGSPYLRIGPGGGSKRGPVKAGGRGSSKGSGPGFQFSGTGFGGGKPRENINANHNASTHNKSNHSLATARSSSKASIRGNSAGPNTGRGRTPKRASLGTPLTGKPPAGPPKCDIVGMYQKTQSARKRMGSLCA